MREAERHRILIIDEDDKLLDELCSELNLLYGNCLTCKAIRAFQGISVAMNEKPDLILADWHLSDLPGVRFMHHLKSQIITQDIPVIIMAAPPCDSKILSQAFAAGAVDFIRKPLDLIELKARVESVLQVSKKHRYSIEQKNKELFSRLLNLKKLSIIQDRLLTKLKGYLPGSNLLQKDKRALSSIVGLLEKNDSTGDWKQFELSFNSVYPFFMERLLAKHSHLSLTDVRMCLFIKLNLSIKNMADLLHQKEGSVKVARSRLRKKLELTTQQNLSAYINQF